MSTNLQSFSINSTDIEAIKKAKLQIERLGLVMRGLNTVGNKLEKGINFLPLKQQKWIQKIVQETLLVVVKSNLLTMKKGKSFSKPNIKTYKALTTTSGVLGGFFGASAFATDLGISTKLIMRSIIDIARSNGENIYSYDTQLACLQVFALGGKTKHDDDLDTSYYATRVALSSSMNGASTYLAKNGLEGLSKSLLTSTHPILQAIGSIAARYSVQVSEKFIAQVVPIIGAAGGGALNFAFINHFQTMATAHFTIRKLERKYSEALVAEVYHKIKLKR